MPDWVPDWNDVAFDHVSAAAAAHTCEAVAARVRHATAERHDLAQHARVDWHGPLRWEFDRTIARLDRQAAAVEADLRRTAQALRDASRQALAEQAGRQEARERWLLESRAELHRAEAARAGP